jgi:alkanesulfonate monooxygenase SsuD/methylene tetrahydromethanopterin reductase-like flavin-dependent oxidoreductase (luciferase family)
VWVSDHLFLDWGKYGGSGDVQGSLECWTTLSALAAATQRVRLGSLTLCNDFRNPALLAKMAATLDLLSGGRLDIGLGAGWYEAEYKAAGIPFDRPGIRIARLRESVQVISRMLEGEKLTFDGKYCRTDGALCRPLPLQEPRPPIWIGGKGDRLLATVVDVADGWNMSWLGDIAAYEERLALANKLCEQGGRDPKTLRRSVGAYVLAGTDDGDVQRRFERLVARTPPGVLKASTTGAAVSWEEFKQTRFAGTVGEVTDKLGRLADLGVEEVIVCLGAVPFQVSDLEEVEFVGTEIAGTFRSEVVS